MEIIGLWPKGWVYIWLALRILGFISEQSYMVENNKAKVWESFLSVLREACLTVRQRFGFSFYSIKTEL